MSKPAEDSANFSLPNQKTLYIYVKYNPKSLHFKSYLILETAASHDTTLHYVVEGGRVGEVWRSEYCRLDSL
jgi:hypothetical protein